MKKLGNQIKQNQIIHSYNQTFS